MGEWIGVLCMCRLGAEWACVQLGACLVVAMWAICVGADTGCMFIMDVYMSALCLNAGSFNHIC